MLSNKYVPPEGKVEAPYYIIGEAPGETEEKELRPFIGKSGELLFETLSKVGISRDSCYITNLCNYRPSQNNFSFCEGTNELAKGISEVKSAISTNKPKAILLLGQQPAKYLTDSKLKISTLRGYPCEVESSLGIYTYHPSFILRAPSEFPIWSRDLYRYSEIGKGKYAPVNPTIYKPTEALDIEEWLEKIEAADLITLDIENVPKTKLITSIAVGLSPNLAIAFSPDESIIRRICECKAAKSLQNGTHDITILAENGFIVVNYQFDTHLASHVLYPELPRSLEELVSYYTWMKPYKHLSKVDLKKYNALDCIGTWLVMDEQKKELEEWSTEQLEYEISLVEVCIHMSRSGQLIDLERRKEISRELSKKRTAAESVINALAGKKINVQSSKDVPELLYAKLKLPVRRHQQTGKVTTNDAALVSLISLAADKCKEAMGESAKEHWNNCFMVLKCVKLVRGLRKLESSYINVKISSDGRARSLYKVGATETGRLAADKYYDDTGWNAQTLPREVIEVR